MAGRTPGGGPSGLILALRSRTARQSQPRSGEIAKRFPPCIIVNRVPPGMAPAACYGRRLQRGPGDVRRPRPNRQPPPETPTVLRAEAALAQTCGAGASFDPGGERIGVSAPAQDEGTNWMVCAANWALRRFKRAGGRGADSLAVDARFGLNGDGLGLERQGLQELPHVGFRSQQIPQGGLLEDAVRSEEHTSE